MGRLCSKSEQLDLLRSHEIELARLQSALEEMGAQLVGASEAQKLRILRSIEYATARITRQEINIALLSSQIVSKG